MRCAPGVDLKLCLNKSKGEKTMGNDYKIIFTIGKYFLAKHFVYGFLIARSENDSYRILKIF